MIAGWSTRVGDRDPIALLEVEGDSLWVHTIGHPEKPLTTRVSRLSTSPAGRSK